MRLVLLSWRKLVACICCRSRSGGSSPAYIKVAERRVLISNPASHAPKIRRDQEVVREVLGLSC